MVYVLKIAAVDSENKDKQQLERSDANFLKNTETLA